MHARRASSRFAASARTAPNAGGQIVSPAAGHSAHPFAARPTRARWCRLPRRSGRRRRAAQCARSIRWQAMRDLTDAPADEVAAERARVAREGAGAAARPPGGRRPVARRATAGGIPRCASCGCCATWVSTPPARRHGARWASSATTRRGRGAVRRSATTGTYHQPVRGSLQGDAPTSCPHRPARGLTANTVSTAGVWHRRKMRCLRR